MLVRSEQSWTATGRGRDSRPDYRSLPYGRGSVWTGLRFGPVT